MDHSVRSERKIVKIRLATCMDTTENEIPLERRLGLLKRRIAINNCVREIMKSYWERQNDAVLKAWQESQHLGPETETSAIQDTLGSV